MTCEIRPETGEIFFLKERCVEEAGKVLYNQHSMLIVGRGNLFISNAQLVLLGDKGADR